MTTLPAPASGAARGERSQPRRLARAWPAGLALTGLAAFWSGVLLAAAVNPGYVHRRDYVSALASHGAEHGALGVAAIAAAAVAMLAASLLVRSLSRAAAVLVALAGAGYLVVSLARVECRNGAAGCGVGGGFAVSGTAEIAHWSAAEIAHWTAVNASTVLLVAGIALTARALLRRGSAGAGLASVAAASATIASFLVMGGQSPGVAQRVGIVVATGWLAAVAVAALVQRPSERQQAQARIP